MSELYDKRNIRFFPRIFNRYYLIAVLFEFVHVFFNSFRYGVICSVLLFCFWIFVFWHNYINPVKKIELVLFLYIGITVLSLCVLAMNGVSVSIGVAEIATGILPIVYYYFGKWADYYSEQLFLKYFVLASLFVLLVGLYFFVFTPSIYYRYMANNNYAFFQSVYDASPRMESFVGSSGVGGLASILFSISLFRLANAVDTKSRVFSIFCVLISLLGAVMSLQRVAWLCCALVLFAYLLLYSRHKARIIAIAALILIFGIIVFMRSDIINTIVLGRLKGSENIFLERNASWGKVLQQDFLSLLIGNGIGISGHRTTQISTGALAIHDGAYFKVLYEVGFVGFFSLIILLSSSMLKGWKNYKKKKSRDSILYLSIVCIIVVHAIGSNVFQFQLLMPIFWFSIAKCQKVFHKS